MSVLKFTSQEVSAHREKHNSSMQGAVAALKKRDLLAAVEEFRDTADADLLSDILNQIIVDAL
jgi:fatty acid/phospholipid biosynthesis enzyme